MHDYDVIIVGGGPAGLSAAQTLGRAKRLTLVLDSGEYRNAPASHMHNVITRDGTSPAEFRAVAREELRHYTSVEVREETALDAVAEGNDGFAVTLRDGERVTARRIILATGVVDELPDIAGIGDLWGRGVFHCPYCHGYEVRDTAITVLGATPAAVHLAFHMRRLSDDVVLCTHGEDIDTSVLEAQGIRIRTERVTALQGHDGHLDAVDFGEGDRLLRDALFCAIGVMRQRSNLVARLGCSISGDDAVEVDSFGATSVPGVYAAGDMARQRDLPGRVSAVIAAAASGTMAGAMADRELLQGDIAGYRPPGAVEVGSGPRGGEGSSLPSRR